MRTSDRFRYNVAPRYSCGSPALVDHKTALDVKYYEEIFYGYAMEGLMGEEWKAKAESLGLSWIVEERTMYARHYLAFDLITGEKRDSRFSQRKA